MSTPASAPIPVPPGTHHASDQAAPPVPAPPGSTGAPGPRRLGVQTFRALRHRNYRLYFTGQLISLTGSWSQGAALTWVAYASTEPANRNSWAALISASQIIPTLLLGVWGGCLADRWPRRPLIFAAQSLLFLLAMVLAGMVFAHAINPWGLLTVSLLIGVVNAIDTPARLAFVIDMVGREDLANAVALNSLLFNVARAVGPAISAILLPWLGAGACFLFNGLTFAAVLGALAAMRLPPRQAQVSGAPPAANLLSAFRYLADHRELVLLVILAGSVALFGWPLLSLLPAVSVELLHAGNQGHSCLLSAIGGGALVGALVVASSSGGRGRLLLLGGGVALGALSLGCLALVRDLPLAVLCCAGAGGGLILFFATGQATLQLGSADHNRGRVMGIWLMVLSGANPVGHLLSGKLADIWGVAPVLAGQAAGITLTALLIASLALLGRQPPPVPLESESIQADGG